MRAVLVGTQRIRPWRVLATLLAAICSVVLSTSAYADTGKSYPSEKSVSMIVPYPAGGPSDASARIFSEAIGKALGRPVVVENIGGATGTIAASKLLNSPADGYAFFHGSPNELILPTLINKAISYKPEEFTLVQHTTSATIILLTRSDLGVDTLDDFLRLAQKRDGKPLTYASVGTGSLYHLITARMAKEMDLNVEHVPYRGSAPALTDLAGGHVDFAILAFQTSMLALQESGRLKIVSTMGTKAPESLKGIPKVTDSKLLKDFDYGINAGYFVKTGTPESVIEKLHAAVGSALQDDAVRERLEIEGRIVAHPLSAEDNKAFWEDEINSLRKLVDIVEFEPV